MCVCVSVLIFGFVEIHAPHGPVYPFPSPSYGLHPATRVGALIVSAVVSRIASLGLVGRKIWYHLIRSLKAGPQIPRPGRIATSQLILFLHLWCLTYDEPGSLPLRSSESKVRCTYIYPRCTDTFREHYDCDDAPVRSSPQRWQLG